MSAAIQSPNLSMGGRLELSHRLFSLLVNLLVYDSTPRDFPFSKEARTRETVTQWKTIFHFSLANRDVCKSRRNPLEYTSGWVELFLKDRGTSSFPPWWIECIRWSSDELFHATTVIKECNALYQMLVLQRCKPESNCRDMTNKWAGPSWWW